MFKNNHYQSITFMNKLKHILSNIPFYAYIILAFTIGVLAILQRYDVILLNLIIFITACLLQYSYNYNKIRWLQK